jgi:acetyl-CoA carboxylase carboxyltransferase component
MPQTSTGTEAVSADGLAEEIEYALAGGDRARLGTKLPARDRLALLLDPGSFVEDGLLATARDERLPADAVITGTGTVDGRRVAVIAHDLAEPSTFRVIDGGRRVRVS